MLYTNGLDNSQTPKAENGAFLHRLSVGLDRLTGAQGGEAPGDEGVYGCTVLLRYLL